MCQVCTSVYNYQADLWGGKHVCEDPQGQHLIRGRGFLRQIPGHRVQYMYNTVKSLYKLCSYVLIDKSSLCHIWRIWSESTSPGFLLFLCPAVHVILSLLVSFSILFYMAVHVKLSLLVSFSILFYISIYWHSVETSGEEIRYAIEREIREIIIVRVISLFSTCDWNRYT